LRGSNKLTVRKVATLAKPGRYGDGRGLWLQVSQSGTKSWMFRFMRDGVPRHMGLGPIYDVSLAEAREKASAARKQLLDGLDPIQVRQAARIQVRLEAARTMSFRQAAETYIKSHESGWKGHKHAAQWSATLETYAFPLIGHLPVTAIDTALVLKVLEPIWNKTTETANRVRGRIEKVLDFVKAQGTPTGENPARWRGHLATQLPARSDVSPVEHHPALPYGAIPTFMGDLRSREGVSARALEFTILSGLRTSEVIGARWAEFDFLKNEWTVPGTRMKGRKNKARRDHRVPLCPDVIDILQNLPREGEYVFPGQRAGQPISNMAMLKVLKRMGRADLTVHGFRSSFRDWAAERTNYPREVCEMALAHTIGNDVEAAYRRGDLFTKRAALMRDWAHYCSTAPSTAVNVVPLRAGS
jgi:integrase